MSKKGGGMDMECDKIGSESNNTKRVCPFCPKEFSSGKALGGHMSFHVQKKMKDDENSLPKKTRFKKTRFGSSKVGDDVSTTPVCAICGKDFPSWKSLYGHMRCHPERGWRGTFPPPLSSSSSSARSDVVDLAASLKAWPVTAERGRTLAPTDAASSEVSSSSAVDDAEMLEAVNHLLMLSRGTPLLSSVTKNKKRRMRKKLSDLESENKVKIVIIDSSDSPVCRSGLAFDLNELPPFDVM